jgi:hypothetical protein
MLQNLQMDTTTRAHLIERYRDGHRAVLAALEGASETDLDRHPPDGTWSARQVVHHLADSEMTSALRVRRLLAEEDPAIVGYDEELWSQRVYYDRPIGPSLDAFGAARASTAAILERMTGSEWQRGGRHSEIGRYTPEIWLEIYAQHGHDHADQIRRALGRV